MQRYKPKWNKVMIDLKTVAEFEITTADMFNKHKSEKSGNYTDL